MIKFIREDKYSTRLHDSYRMAEQFFSPELASCLEECEIEINGYSKLQVGKSLFDLCPACQDCADQPLQIGPACDLCKKCGGHGGYEVSKCVQNCLSRTGGSRPAGSEPGGRTNKLTY